MRRAALISNKYAISEVIAGVLLILIAVLAFASVYVYLFPPAPEVEADASIQGYVNSLGSIVLEHKGGDTITNLKLTIYNYSNIEQNWTGDFDVSWKIGSYIYPLDLIEIPNPPRLIEVFVHCKDTEGEFEQIFHGIFDTDLDGDDEIPEENPENITIEDPMLISSIQTNSVDEDLICYNDTVDAPEETETYIYNWTMNGNPITYLLYPFDTNDISTTTDYSGNENNGTVFNAIWNSDGKVGGCYEFTGDSSITIPYCFNANGYIDDITIEFWIKTDVNTQTIASFGDGDFWKLMLEDGKIKWITNSTEGTGEINGLTGISDGNWHHVATTYDYSTGNCAIYIDGFEEKTESIFTGNTLLGNGETPEGSIGKSEDSMLQETWNILTYDNFESGMGNYHDGGSDCGVVSWYSHQGSYSAIVRDDRGWYSSFWHDDGIDVDDPEYVSIKLDFWWMWNDYPVRHNPGWEYYEDWKIWYYDGSDWEEILDRNYPSDYSEDTWYHEILYINETEYNFPSNMRILFECSAEDDNERVFFDQIYVNATVGSSGIANLSGFLDEFKIYNRSLSAEQVYQNYLCSKDGFTNKSVIVSEETILGEIWSCTVTPKNSLQDFGSETSSDILIINYGGGD